jgi:hypothetical protein
MRRGILLTTTVLILLNFVVVASGSSTINIEDVEIAGIGKTETLKITLDNIPQGLSGYNITISLNDPSVVAIVTVSFPSWATFQSNSSLPGSSVWLKVADLNKQVEAGAINVLLATLSIESIQIGHTFVDISIKQLDDDDGYPIASDIQNVTVTVIQQQSGGDTGGNSGDGGSNGGDKDNILPIANAGGPYIGVVDEDITFDASKSYDPDGGNITFWKWDFGDGTNGTGEIVDHSYSNIGEYMASLTVKDDEDTTASNKFTVSITQPNIPPSKPILKGNISGNKNTTYQYDVLSVDLDNDTIKYTIDWNDGTAPDVSNFLPSGNTYTTFHSWTEAGRYTITISADDNKTITKNETKIYIDAKNVGNIGYITDDNSDGVYDKFYDGEGLVTDLGKENEKYLIDSNKDGEYDYIFNPETGVITFLEGKDTAETHDVYRIMLVGIIVIIAIITILAFIYKKKYLL